MKKNGVKKLRLSRQTLRYLASLDAQRVVGGIDMSSETQGDDGSRVASCMSGFACTSCVDTR
jgi:hypothetical protein